MQAIEVIVPNSGGETVRLSELLMLHGKFTNSLDISKYFDLNYRRDGKGIDVFNYAGRQAPLEFRGFITSDSSQVNTTIANIDSLYNFENFFILDKNIRYTNSLTMEEQNAYDPFTNNFSEKIGWIVSIGSQNETNSKAINKVIAYGNQTWYIGGEITLSRGVGLSERAIEKELSYRLKAHGDVEDSFRHSIGNTAPNKITFMDRALTNNEEMYYYLKGLGLEDLSGYRTDYMRIQFND